MGNSVHMHWVAKYEEICGVAGCLIYTHILNKIVLLCDKQIQLLVYHKIVRSRRLSQLVASIIQGSVDRSYSRC